MPRPFNFPDINDRSVNSPIFLVSPEQVLGNYNQNNKRNEQGRVTEEVKKWFIQIAIDKGWSKAEFFGNQCLLEVSFETVS